MQQCFLAFLYSFARLLCRACFGHGLIIYLTKEFFILRQFSVTCAWYIFRALNTFTFSSFTMIFKNPLF